VFKKRLTISHTKFDVFKKHKSLNKEKALLTLHKEVTKRPRPIVNITVKTVQSKS